MQSSETLAITANHETSETEGGGRGVTNPSNSKRAYPLDFRAIRPARGNWGYSHCYRLNLLHHFDLRLGGYGAGVGLHHGLHHKRAVERAGVWGECQH